MFVNLKVSDQDIKKIRDGAHTIIFCDPDPLWVTLYFGETAYCHNGYDTEVCVITGFWHAASFGNIFSEEDFVAMLEDTDTSSYSQMVIEVKKADRDYLIDGHMHLEYGPLSKEYVLEFVEAAKMKGLDEINILDHTHRFKEFRGCYRHLEIYPEQAGWLDSSTKFCNTLEEYEELIKEIKKMDLGINIRFGLEVCYTKDTEEQLRDILKNYHFDFLTGAVHSFNHILYDMPFSKKLLWDKYDVNDIYRDYYVAVMYCINSGLFDRLAHPDTIKMFDYYPDYDLMETYHNLAKALNRQGMLAENNTGCHYRYGHKDIGLSDEVLKVFKEEKTPLITASDAHHPEDVGSYIKEATLRIKGGR